MNKCHNYSKKWRYEFHHSKSGVVTFGEPKPIHCKSMKERKWALGDDTVEEHYEYKGLAKLSNIACQTLLFVSVSLAMDNQRTLLLRREQ